MHKALLRSWLAFVLFSFTFAPVARADDAALTQRVATLEREVSSLKTQNQTLRTENDNLKKALAAERAKHATIDGATPTPLVGAAPVKPATSAATHWITTASGKRHNSGCRYYQNSKGRPCGPDEGMACKICGG